MLAIPVGNVSADTELTYEYGVRTKTRGGRPGTSSGVTVSEGAGPEAEPAEVPALMIGGHAHLPFQLQITFTGQDGSRRMRVITQSKPTTRDRSVAEKGQGHG